MRQVLSQLCETILLVYPSSKESHLEIVNNNKFLNISNLVGRCKSPVSFLQTHICERVYRTNISNILIYVKRYLVLRERNMYKDFYIPEKTDIA